jgi:transposase
MTINKRYKMADNDVSFCQHAVIEFFVKEEIPTAHIHHRLQRVYGDVCMGVSSVRQWVKHFKDGNTSIQDQPCSGHPRTASTEPNKQRVDEIIKDRPVMLDAVATKLAIRHNAVQEMIGSLGYQKICTVGYDVY